MADESVLTSAAAIVKSLAASPQSSSSTPPDSSSPVRLAGPEGPAKEALERELSALVVRIRQLEAKASNSSQATFPATPNETGDSLFGEAPPLPSAAGQVTHRSDSGTGRNGTAEDRSTKGFPLTDEALEGLREHIDDQSKVLDSQRQELSSVSEQLLEQKQLQEKALRVLEEERVAALERELWKHQKANEAFQKALREIGEIVTAVARGDLSKKVRMNTVEMDPEITTFKRTINTMMDQLQVFASEVSRVAREVGTDGMLGGQAMIQGVDGTWKELTDNGWSLRVKLLLCHCILISMS